MASSSSAATSSANDNQTYYVKLSRGELIKLAMEETRKQGISFRKLKLMDWNNIFWRSYGIFGTEKSSLPENVIDKLYAEMKVFLQKVEARYQKCNRTSERLLDTFPTFFDHDLLSDELNIQMTALLTTVKAQGGRPETPFKDLCDSGKRKKTKTLRTEDVLSLAFATQMELRKLNQNDAAAIVTEAVFNSPYRASKMKLLMEKGKTKPSQYSSEKALALLLDLDLSKEGYQHLRTSTKLQGHEIFPSYKKILEAKKECYPCNIAVSERGASVELQDLLDHTSRKLLLCLDELLDFSRFKKIKFFYKYGFDGTSGQSNYKQGSEHLDFDDSSLFVVSLLPLYVTGKEQSERKIIWKNPAPGSTRLCRPLKFVFARETKDLVKAVSDDITTQIQALKSSETVIDGTRITVTHELSLTMVDGKAINYLTDTSSSQVCYLCQAKPSNVNDLELMASKTIASESSLSFGMSPLHARIRSLECMLHIAYRLPVKKYYIQKKNAEDLKSFEEQRKKIREELKKDLGLLIDIPKPGYGTTNDGNTARSFFNNVDNVSKITGLDKDLLEKFSVILTVINCDFTVDPKKFGAYSENVAKLYVELYGWYPMPPTIHKILMHGEQILRHNIIPIGALTEEAQESLNKVYKSFRREHTRKINRVATNEDLFQRLLLSSDPFINSLRKKTLNKKKVQLSSEALSLLQDPQDYLSLIDDSDDDSDMEVDN